MNIHQSDYQNPIFKNNQGIINARVERLYREDKTTLKKYTETLTEIQKQEARNHLKTVIKLYDNH